MRATLHPWPSLVPCLSLAGTSPPCALRTLIISRPSESGLVLGHFCRPIHVLPFPQHHQQTAYTRRHHCTPRPSQPHLTLLESWFSGLARFDLSRNCSSIAIDLLSGNAALLSVPTPVRPGLTPSHEKRRHPRFYLLISLQTCHTNGITQICPLAVLVPLPRHPPQHDARLPKSPT